MQNGFPRTSPILTEIVPSGHIGWMKFATASEAGLSGAIITYNPATESSGSAFSQGHNLHRLTLTTAASYTIPIFPPGC